MGDKKKKKNHSILIRVVQWCIVFDRIERTRTRARRAKREKPLVHDPIGNDRHHTHYCCYFRCKRYVGLEVDSFKIRLTFEFVDRSDF